MEDNTKRIIGKRINTLLATNDIKQKELAELLGVKDNIISYYCSGARVPNMEQLIKISRHFDISLDYLVGNTEIQTIDTNIRAICDYTGLSEKSIDALNAQTKIEENNITYFHDDDYCNVSTEFIDYFISSNAIFEIASLIDKCNDRYRNSNEAFTYLIDSYDRYRKSNESSTDKTESATDKIKCYSMDDFFHGQDFEAFARVFSYEAVQKFTDTINKFINEVKGNNNALMKKSEAIYIEYIKQINSEYKDSEEKWQQYKSVKAHI